VGDAHLEPGLVQDRKDELAELPRLVGQQRGAGSGERRGGRRGVDCEGRPATLALQPDRSLADLGIVDPVARLAPGALDDHGPLAGSPEAATWRSDFSRARPTSPRKISRPRVSPTGAVLSPLSP